MCIVYHYDNGDLCLKDNNSIIVIKQAHIDEVIEQMQSPYRGLESIVKDFESFWVAYPKKQGKSACKKKWLAMNPNQELTEMIMKSVEMFKETEQWQKNGGQFIPMPSTWLNQKRWEDELDVVMDVINELKTGDW